jgi:hypothetical protein
MTVVAVAEKAIIIALTLAAVAPWSTGADAAASRTPYVPENQAKPL